MPGDNFLDEPTSGLDPKARHEMLDTINGLTKVSNTNVLLSTHILQDVETVCDHVIIVNNGKLQMKESVNELMKKQNDFIQVRLGGDIDGFANILKMKKINLLSDGRTLRVPYVNEETFQQIIDAAVESKCQLYEMERSKVTMDNVYLEAIE